MGNKGTELDGYLAPSVYREYRILDPLLLGRTVSLTVFDPRMHKKKRTQDVVVYLTPLGSDNLLVSVPGYGAEIVPTGDTKSVDLFRAGLSMQAARALADALNDVYKRGNTDGRTYPPAPSAGSPFRSDRGHRRNACTPPARFDW